MLKCELCKGPQIVTSIDHVLLQIGLLNYLGPKWTFITVLQVPWKCFSPLDASKACAIPSHLPCAVARHSLAPLWEQKKHIYVAALWISVQATALDDLWKSFPAYVILSFCITDHFVWRWCLETYSDNLRKSTLLGLRLKSTPIKMAPVFQQNKRQSGIWMLWTTVHSESLPLIFVLAHSQSAYPYFAITK